MLVLSRSMDFILQVKLFFLVISGWHSKVLFIKFYCESTSCLCSYCGIFHSWIQKPKCVLICYQTEFLSWYHKENVFLTFSILLTQSYILTWTILHKLHLAFLPIWKTSYEPMCINYIFLFRLHNEMHLLASLYMKFL